MQRIYTQTLDIIAPSLLANKVYHYLSNPKVKKLRDFEDVVLKQSEINDIAFKGHYLKSYTWGNPNGKKVLLVHGWEGQAGNFGAIVEILVSKGYYVQAFDAPAHGYSSKGSTHMFEYAEFISKQMKIIQPEFVISHSFGAVTTLVSALSNPAVEIKKWLMVTTPHNFKTRLKDVKKEIGITNRTMDKIVEKLEADTGKKLDELNMGYYGSRIKNIEDIKIVHSKTDKVIPIESAKYVQAHIPDSKLIELEDLGHYSILWSEELKDIVQDEF